MTSPLPPAEELALVERELAALDIRRAHLLARRDWLLRVLHAMRTPSPVPVPVPVPSTMPGPGPGRSAEPWPAVRSRPDASPRDTQNVLLTLGGVLLSVAALVFTLVSWGSMGIGGRSAVLGVVTAAALLVPVVLLRRGLRSTAEAVAALGLLLTVLDAYALHRVVFAATGGLAYTAVVSAVLAAAWGGYGRALSGPRLPLPAAVVAAQLPLPLGVAAADGGGLPVTWAMLLTALADLAVLVSVKPSAPRTTAGAAAAVLGGWALCVGLVLSFDARLTALPLLVVCAAALLWLGSRYARTQAAPASFAAAVAAGIALIAAAGGAYRSLVSDAWLVAVYALLGVGLAAAVLVRRARPGVLRRGLAAAGGGVLGLGVLWALPPAAVGLLAPAGAEATWARDLSDAVMTAYAWSALPVLLIAVVATALVPRLWARGPALVLVWVLLTELPVALLLPYGWTLATRLLTTAAALALAARPVPALRGVRLPAGGWPATLVGWLGCACGLLSAGSALGVAVDTRAGTFVALGVLVVLFGGLAAVGAGGRRLVAGGVAVLTVAGLVAEGAAVAGLDPVAAGLVLLVVPAGSAAVGGWLRRHPLALVVEATGAAVGVVALVLAAGRAAPGALALALAGVIAAATAVRAERRQVASWCAAALFLLASWVRLAAWEVTVPEAYTLPVTVPALVVGVLRRRTDREASSWTAYGPGLAVTLVPSLLAVWAVPGGPRPLLLGGAALLVTLVGARWRLQAPLVLGGMVLALVGAHELTPYVLRAVAALPRWLPPALAGLLLLAVGATYEQRLRDARRLRERLGRLR